MIPRTWRRRLLDDNLVLTVYVSASAVAFAVVTIVEALKR